VLFGFLGQERGVRAAENHHLASAAKCFGQPVNVAGIRSVAGDSHQIDRSVERNRLVVLIDDRDLMRRLDKSRQIRHRELWKVVELPSAKCPDMAILGSDQ